MNKRYIYPWYFLVVALALYVFVYIAPNLIGVYDSFTDHTKYSSSVSWVGFSNYVTIFSKGENYLSFIGNTLEFTLFTTLLKTILAFAFALLLLNPLPGRDVFRGVIFAPAILSFLVTGLIFKSFLHPDSGFLNQLLRFVGLGALAKGWLISTNYALLSCICVDTWRGTGYLMTIMIAGLQSIPRMYFEAAEIDGAGWFGRLRFVTVPLLVPSISVTLVLNIVYGLSVFDVIYVLTNGGPANATGVLNTAVFTEFAGGYYAMANALSTVMFILMAGIAIYVVRALNKRIVEVS